MIVMNDKVGSNSIFDHSALQAIVALAINGTSATGKKIAITSIAIICVKM